MRNAFTLIESICAASSAVISSEPIETLVFILQTQIQPIKYLTNASEMLYSHIISTEHLISIAYIISIAHLCAQCQDISCVAFDVL